MTQDHHATRFTALYRENYSLVLSTCVRRLGDLATAEDATAEVFRVAWQRFPEVGNPTIGWLYGVARNVIGNEYRRNARAVALRDHIEEEASGLSGTNDDSREDTLSVRMAMGHLRPSDRELLYMFYWEDLAGSEIAEILEISLPSVWVRLNRARSALHTILIGGLSNRSNRYG